ncbi:MAG: radical SAM protein [Candidatus Heimdallarchaeota archaeon]
MHSVYDGSVWRPPSEAQSLIIQASIGCSHNQCAFCISYKGKRYRIRSLDEFEKHVDAVRATYPFPVRRIFLADGNALSIPTATLQQMVAILKQRIPTVERIGIYAYATDCLDKSVEDLKSLRKAGINMAYVGIESGDDNILSRMSKGVTNAENIEACLKLRQAGIKLSAIIILGLGGTSLSKQHARATAETINSIKPEYLGALTLMLPEGTRIHKEFLAGDFSPLNPVETLIELKELLTGLNQLKGTIFRTNHASNYLPIRGKLSEDRSKLLTLLEETLAQPDLQQSLKPEIARGL